MAHSCEYSIFQDNVFHSWRYYGITTKAITPWLVRWGHQKSHLRSDLLIFPIADYERLKYPTVQIVIVSLE